MVERATRTYRATTVEPSTLYTRSYHVGSGLSAFDYKVGGGGGRGVAKNDLQKLSKSYKYDSS
jgi:hypothetical protein